MGNKGNKEAKPSLLKKNSKTMIDTYNPKDSP
jgi:hypothetical protein